MTVRTFSDAATLGRAAATHVADVIRAAVAQRGKARVLASLPPAGTRFLELLAGEPGLAWDEVDLFHTDELIGLPVDDRRTTRRRLFEGLIARARVGRYHLLDGQHDPERSCRDEGEHLRSAPLDVAWVELGDNGQLGFNEPPADFFTETPYAIVRIDDPRRRELVENGRFKDIAEVPDRAISISIRQLMKAANLVCFATSASQGEALKRCVEGAASPLAPASILQTHPAATFYVLREAAAALGARKGQRS